MQPFIPAGELFAPSERAVVPANGTATVTIRSFDGYSFGINRLLFDAPNLAAVTVKGVVGGERLIVEGVHLDAFRPLFQHRALRNPIVIPTGQVLDLTFSNASNVPVPVGVLVDGFTSVQLDALRAYRESEGVPLREGGFLWGSVDVAANQDRKRLDVPMRTGGATLARLFLGANHTDAAATDATGDLIAGVSAQGRDLIRTATPAQLEALMGSRELVPPVRLGAMDTLTLFLTNQSATPARVSLLAEALR